METSEFDFIDTCVDLEGKVFYYFRDKFALDILKWHVGHGKTMAEIKKSHVAGLLEKPAVKNITKHAGNGQIRAALFDNYWPVEIFGFRLSIGKWVGKWKTRRDNFRQTSRSGINLVLRLDFGKKHDREYQRLIMPAVPEAEIFERSCHPINPCAKTLAWARIDIDMDNGEALIEEIQNDWIRIADRVYKTVAEQCVKREKERSNFVFFKQSNASFSKLSAYYTQVLAPYRPIWDEAMMHAAVSFLRNELGINRIFYHTWETGNALKKLRNGYQPPISLYTKLPRKFGFKPTENSPKMLSEVMKTLRLNGEVYEWFLLEV